MTCEATPNAISSPDWGFGRTPSDVPGGMTSAQFGQALAPANLSHRQAKALGLETSGIYGQRSSTSSRSAALKQFAESRLRARTDTLGSTLYKLTWKDWPTPFGRSFSLLRASAARTSGTGFGGSGWPTPMANTRERSDETIAKGIAHRQEAYGKSTLPVYLNDIRLLAAWPTPHVGTPQSMRGTGQDPETRRAQGRQVGLQDAVRWAGWSTPKTATGGANSNREERKAGGPDLQEQARWAGWPTPQANDSEKRGSPSLTPGAQSCLPTAVPALAAWVTPSARDWKDTPGMATERPDGKPRNDQLPRQAYLSGWPTCRAEDSESAGARLGRGVADTVTAVARLSRWTTTDGPARLTVSGEMLIGCSARMESGGQLNPEHARWLMACPSQWGRSAPGWADYALWQELTEIASSEPSSTASEPYAATATPSPPNRP